MKKIVTLLFAIVAFAAFAGSNGPGAGKPTFEPLDSNKINLNAQIGEPLDLSSIQKVTKSTQKAASNIHLMAEPPAGATIETDWAITGNYINSNNPYSNSNDIAVAFDGNDVYIKGMVFLCPDAWIQGTISGSTATFANGQEAGTYNSSTIYACGSNDGNTLSSIIFEYDANAQTFTLSNFYIENTSTTAMSYYFYSYDLVIAKEIPIPDAPSNVVATPDVNSADIAWTENGNATVWNLRYRPYVPVEQRNLFFDFEDTEQLDGWMAVDADGDGNNWGWADARYTTHSGNGVMISESYNSDGALTPENWLITPSFQLGGKVSFYACGQDQDYAAEVFGVYVCTGEPTSLDDFVQLGQDIIATGEMTLYEFDLSAYEGAGRVAIVHHNITDMFVLNIDDVTIEIPGGINPPEWTVVEEVANPYTIEGLTAETEYEVQVQAINGVTSPWTASTVFTTLAEQLPEPVISITPNFGTYDAAQTVHVTVENMPEGGTIKYELIPSNTKAWEDYNDATGIIVNESAALTVAAFDASGEKLAEVSGEFTITPTTGIETISTNAESNTWYNIAGQKFNGMPTTPGIYINNGKKVVIK